MRLAPVAVDSGRIVEDGRSDPDVADGGMQSRSAVAGAQLSLKRAPNCLPESGLPDEVATRDSGRQLGACAASRPAHGRQRPIVMRSKRATHQATSATTQPETARLE